MDIYYILGLKNNCSTEDIIKKYEKFSKKYNPTNNRNLSNYEIIKFKEFTKEALLAFLASILESEVV